MEWKDFAEGAIGAIIGSVLTILGFKSRLDVIEKIVAGIEKDCEELEAETLAMFREIRDDIKGLIAKTGERRSDD